MQLVFEVLYSSSHLHCSSIFDAVSSLDVKACKVDSMQQHMAGFVALMSACHKSMAFMKAALQLNTEVHACCKHLAESRFLFANAATRRWAVQQVEAVVTKPQFTNSCNQACDPDCKPQHVQPHQACTSNYGCTHCGRTDRCSMNMVGHAAMTSSSPCTNKSGNHM